MNPICTYCHYTLHPVYDPQLDSGQIQMLQCYNATCTYQTRLSINVHDNSIIFYYLAVGQPNNLHHLKGSLIFNYTYLFSHEGETYSSKLAPLIQVNYLPLPHSDYQQQAEKLFIKLLNLLTFS